MRADQGFECPHHRVRGQDPDLGLGGDPGLGQDPRCLGRLLEQRDRDGARRNRLWHMRADQGFECPHHRVRGGQDLPWRCVDRGRLIDLDRVDLRPGPRVERQGELLALRRGHGGGVGLGGRVQGPGLNRQRRDQAKAGPDRGWQRGGPDLPWRCDVASQRSRAHRRLADRMSLTLQLQGRQLTTQLPPQTGGVHAPLPGGQLRGVQEAEVGRIDHPNLAVGVNPQVAQDRAYIGKEELDTDVWVL